MRQYQSLFRHRLHIPSTSPILVSFMVRSHLTTTLHTFVVRNRCCTRLITIAVKCECALKYGFNVGNVKSTCKRGFTVNVFKDFDDVCVGFFHLNL